MTQGRVEALSCFNQTKTGNGVEVVVGKASTVVTGRDGLRDRDVQHDDTFEEKLLVASRDR